MGFTEVLTIIFVVLKVTHNITWSWWLVFLPEIIAAAGYVLVWLIAAVVGIAAFKKLR